MTEYAEAFEQRLNALSTAHDLIGGSGLRWADIRDLLKTELRAFYNSNKLVELSGPETTVSADVAPLLALVFHELVSNSVKYGALSPKGESLTISWKEDAGGLEILWSERVVFPLEKPERRGFGLTLIERAVPHECNGTCEIKFLPHGLEVRFWLPDRAMGEVSKLAKSAPQPKSNGTELQTASQPVVNIVVVEDKSILALELESTLISNGYNGIQIFNDADSCRVSIFDDESTSPELAILDINLGDTTSYTLATKLIERGIKIVFVSGYDEQFDMPESLRSVPRLPKPVDTNDLLQLISLLGIKKL